jgi:hypothetical protein
MEVGGELRTVKEQEEFIRTLQEGDSPASQDDTGDEVLEVLNDEEKDQKEEEKEHKEEVWLTKEELEDMKGKELTALLVQHSLKTWGTLPQMRERYILHFQRVEKSKEAPKLVLPKVTKMKWMALCEGARLIHVLADVKALSAVRRILDGNATNRQEIDKGMAKQSPFIDEKLSVSGVKGHPCGLINEMFHDTDIIYEIPNDFDIVEYPAIAEAIKAGEINPNLCSPRPGRTLYDKYVEYRKLYNGIRRRWAVSGRNCGKSFHHFTSNVLLQYIHLLAGDNDLFCQAMTKEVRGAFSSDDRSSDSAMDSEGSGKRKRVSLLDNAIITMCERMVPSDTPSLSSPSSSSSSSSSSPPRSRRQMVDHVAALSAIEERIIRLSSQIEQMPNGPAKACLESQLLKYIQLLEKENKYEN